MAHIVVVGNEKGGAGKSTVAMHVATALARMGHRVGALDLDSRQKTLGRYIANRARFQAESGRKLPGPRLYDLPDSDPAHPAAGEAGETDRRLAAARAAAEPDNDFIVIDCPGAHTRLSQAGHALADTLITPLNDSFIDFDLLAHVDTDGERILGPSVYAETVWRARQLRARDGRPPIDWIVMRNRLGPQRMTNKRKVGDALDALARRIGFRTGPGFRERVIFRELFPRGLTLLDIKDTGAGLTGAAASLGISGVAARQELRGLIAALNLPGVAARF